MRGVIYGPGFQAHRRVRTNTADHSRSAPTRAMSVRGPTQPLRGLHSRRAGLRALTTAVGRRKKQSRPSGADSSVRWLRSPTCQPCTGAHAARWRRGRGVTSGRGVEGRPEATLIEFTSRVDRRRERANAASPPPPRRREVERGGSPSKSSGGCTMRQRQAPMLDSVQCENQGASDTVGHA
jgi:hypothetical protein